MPLKIYEEPLKGIQQIVAIAAGKGGVGKSTVTVGLAYALTKLGYSVGILDADVYGPSIRKMMGEEKLPYQEEGKLFPAETRGIKLMSMAYFRKEGSSDAVRAPVASSIVTQFLKEISWGPLDFLLVDFPPGTGDIQLTLCQQAKFSGALMVTTPQEVAVIDVKKAIDLFKKVDVPVLGVVENMSYYLSSGSSEPVYLFGKDGGKRLSATAFVPFLGEIAIEPSICRTLEEGQPLFHPAFGSLAEKLISQLVGEAETKFYKDDKQLIVEWPDGIKKRIRFSDLQKRCPCAACNTPSVEEAVGATHIESVGRYAVKIAFTSGCSKGIYPFNFIREISSI